MAVLLKADGLDSLFVMFLLIPVITGITCYANGSAEQRFTLPVSNVLLALVPLIHSLICALAMFLLVATGCANIFFDAGWPLMKPAIFVVSITGISLALVNPFNIPRNARA